MTSQPNQAVSSQVQSAKIEPKTSEKDGLPSQLEHRVNPDHYNWPDFGMSLGTATLKGRDRIKKSQQGLRVRYPKDAFGVDFSGAQWRSRFTKPVDRVLYSYEVRFSDEFDFKKGGKLPGVVGGSKKGSPNSTVTGGYRADGFNGFSVRNMWRADGRLVQYVYHVNARNDYGDDFQWLDTQGKPVYLQRGRWYGLKTCLSLNEVSQSNGEIHSWLDGVKVLSQKGLEFRKVKSIAIDSFFFSTFLGGDDFSWGPLIEGSAEFKNLKIELSPADCG